MHHVMPGYLKRAKDLVINIQLNFLQSAPNSLILQQCLLQHLHI